MRILLATAALFFCVPALAASNEISLEVGTLTSDHATYRAFSNGRGLPSYGLRAGYALTDRIALIGGYHRVRRGAQVNTNTDAFFSSYLVDELSLGAKVDLPLGEVAALYGTASALGYRGTMKLDGDASRNNNPDQLRSSALSAGGMATGGVEFYVQNKSKFTPAVHVEVGYGGVVRHRHTLKDGSDATVALGEMSVSGVAVRAGAGIRF